MTIIAVAGLVLELLGFAAIVQARRARRLLEAAVALLDDDPAEVRRANEMIARADHMLYPWRRVQPPSGTAALERDGEVIAVARVRADGSFDPPLTLGIGETLVIIDDDAPR